MDKKYPTKIISDFKWFKYGPFSWEMGDKYTHMECCPHGEYNSKGSGKIEPKTAVVKGAAEWIECAVCAVKSGHGNPPAELLDGVHQTSKSPMQTSIVSKETNYNASYFKIAKMDLKCNFHSTSKCTKTIKSGSIYLDRYPGSSPECINCAKVGYSDLWVPTLADFGVQEVPKVEIKSGDPTAKKGWIWVKAVPSTSETPAGIAGCKCMNFQVYPTGGCKESVVKGQFYAQHGINSSSILCAACAAETGHGTINGSAVVKKRTKKVPKICIKCNQPLCEICGECETSIGHPAYPQGCRMVGRAICSLDDLAKVKHLLAESQKIRGFVAIADKLSIPKPYQIITEQSDIANWSPSTSKVFVRPCPIRPRHGFVESRLVDGGVIENVNDVVDAIFAEAKAADPQAELMILPYVDSAYNMVITPTRLAVGAGNDGATAGKGSITIPLMGELFKEINKKLYSQAGVDTEADDPYFEAVATKDGGVLFTQLRAGVKIPPAVGDDFIPRDMIVEEVIDASGDLLEWESQVKRIKSGTVVCHVGGSLTSHYGVHCLYNNISVMTSRRPEVGEFLLNKPKGAAPDPESVRRGLSVGITIPLKQDKRYVNPGEISCVDAIRVLLVALHNAGAMGEKDGFWIGFSAAVMQRVGMAASHGEARHKNIPKSGKVNRPAVYKVALADFFAARETLGAAQWSFQNNTWSSGYGGPKWAKCTEATIELDGSIREFLNDPSDIQVGRLITKLNNAVNQAHNGGWWLNKFVDVNEFDRAAAQSITLIAQAGVGMFRVANTQFPDLTGAVERWRVAAPIVVAKSTVLAYQGKENVKSKPKCVPTCTSCGAEYSDLGYSSTTLTAGLTCGASLGGGKSCDGLIKFMHNGEPIEAELDEDNDSNGDKCGDTSCPMCHPQNDEDDDTDEEAPDPPEINEHTNVGGIIPIKSHHKVVVAQGKWIKGNYLHVQIKTDASEGYYSFDLMIPTLNPQKMAEFGGDFSWSGSESHEYVPLPYEQIENTLYKYHNNLAGIKFQFDIQGGGHTFKDLINDKTEETQLEVEGQAKILNDETPF